MEDAKNGHVGLATEWMNKSSAGLSRQQLLNLFDRTIDHLRRASIDKLGPVIFAAIIERALYNCSHQFPVFKSIKAGPLEISFRRLDLTGTSPTTEELCSVFTCLLTEFLSIVDRLTGDVLTPALYAELKTITLDPTQMTHESQERPHGHK